jgi:hypothetical protein
MIRHQTIRRDAYTSSLIGFGENFFKRQIIGGLIEQFQPTDTSVHYAPESIPVTNFGSPISDFD